MQSSLPAQVQQKLINVLASKARRGGEFCLPFDPAKFPVDIRVLFPGYTRYALEIGCGWGEFTRAWAQQNPGTLVIALEKKLARVLSSGRTQLTEGIQNVRYMVLDVAWFFAGIFGAQAFDEITINFPDPWPKARHHKHRFVSGDLADELARLAAPGCRLTFATDNYPYAREAMEVFERHNSWKNTVAPWTALPRLPGRPVSFFESVHRAEGAMIYFVQFEKIPSA